MAYSPAPSTFVSTAPRSTMEPIRRSKLTLALEDLDSMSTVTAELEAEYTRARAAFLKAARALGVHQSLFDDQAAHVAYLGGSHAHKHPISPKGVALREVSIGEVKSEYGRRRD